MTNAEVLIASAKACGLDAFEMQGVVVAEYKTGGTYKWNPPENPEQREMCEDELLRHDYTLIYNDEKGIHTCVKRDRNYLRADIVFRSGDRKQFAMLALAEATKDE